jgi:hypothetical protein
MRFVSLEKFFFVGFLKYQRFKGKGNQGFEVSRNLGFRVMRFLGF